MSQPGTPPKKKKTSSQSSSNPLVREGAARTWLPSAARSRVIIICCVLAALTIAAFHGVFGSQFLSYDDADYVTQNKFIQEGLTAKSIHWAFFSFYASNWHPLTWISHMVDWTLFGNAPGWHHAVSLALHTANALLLFLLLFYMTGFIWRAAMVAFLFALHPIHVESVAWVAERKDVLSTFFWFATTLAYGWYVRKPSWKRMGVTSLAFAFGILSKPMVVTLPFTLLLLDIWPLKRLRFKKDTPWISALPKLVLEKAPLFLLAFLSSFLTYLAQKKGGAVSSEIALPVWVRFCNAAFSYWRYLGKMVWPHPLITYYHHEARNIMVPIALLLAVALVIVTIFIWRMREKRPYFLTGWLWYLGTLVPVIGFPLQVGVQAMAERYSYIPSVGIFAGAVWFVADKFGSYRKQLWIGSLLIIAVITGLTMMQVPIWKNTITLFAHVIDVDPRGEFPNLSLGAAHMREKNYTLAKHYLECALSYNSAGPQTLSYYSFCLMEREPHDPSDLAVAQESLERAYQVAPRNKDVLVNLSELCLKTSRPVDAEKFARMTLDVSPGFLTARYYLADALQAQNRLEEAAQIYRAVIAEDPKNTDAYNNLGIILCTQGYRDQAIDAFRRSIEIKPNQALAHSNMGRVYYEAHRVPEAIAEILQAIAMDPGNAVARNNLGAIYFQQGEYANAVQQFAGALQCNPNYAEAQANYQRAQMALSKK